MVVEYHAQAAIQLVRTDKLHAGMVQAVSVVSSVARLRDGRPDMVRQPGEETTRGRLRRMYLRSSDAFHYVFESSGVDLYATMVAQLR